MDVTDLVDYNVSLLNYNDLTNSFFCLSKNDPTAGFQFDASRVAGNVYPEEANDPAGKAYTLRGCAFLWKKHYAA